MAQNEGQRKATDALAAEIAKRGWTKADLSDAAKVDYGTVSDVLDYSRSPQSRTQAALEAAVEWLPGTYRRIALGAIDEPEYVRRETVAAGDEDEDTLLYRRPAGITDEKWRQLRARTRNLVEWEIEQALRETEGQG
jgi:lambda repressor-like predicted transcriptional regulator